MNIYLYKDGQQLGPFTESEARAHLSTGSVSGADLAWAEGNSDWQPLSTILPPVTAPQPVVRVSILKESLLDLLDSCQFLNRHPVVTIVAAIVLPTIILCVGFAVIFPDPPLTEEQKKQEERMRIFYKKEERRAKDIETLRKAAAIVDEERATRP